MSNLFYLIKHLLLFPACLIYLIYSLFVRFINLCHLINLSSSYQTSAIFSPLVIYSLYTLSCHPINAPAVHTTHTTLFPSYRAHALCANIPYPNSIGVFGQRAILMWGDRDMAWGFLYEQAIPFNLLLGKADEEVDSWHKHVTKEYLVLPKENYEFICLAYEDMKGSTFRLKCA